MASPIKVGVLGIGQRGLQHVAALLRLQEEEEVRLVALADPNPENLIESNIQKRAPDYRAGGIGLFSGFDEMMAGADLDALWFVIPPNQHRGEVVRAAEAGVAIMAEKPQTLFLDEALEMAEAIEKAGVVSTAGFQMRYDSWYTAVREHMADRRLASAMMVSVGGVEGHSRKFTATERLGGPENRVWTANRAWSGSSVVEAGIHQTDIMRYWASDDIEWVQAAYAPRPPELHHVEGDNPIAYTVAYGFKRGGVGNLVLTRPARVFFNERYDYVLSTHSQVKFEDDLVAYYYEGDDYPPAERPSRDQVRHVLARGPHREAMGAHNTLAMNRAFARAVAESNPDLLHTTFGDSVNSLAAVLAANVSDQLKGERIYLDQFAGASRFARFRARPGGLPR